MGLVFVCTTASYTIERDLWMNSRRVVEHKLLVTFLACMLVFGSLLLDHAAPYAFSGNTEQSSMQNSSIDGNGVASDNEGLVENTSPNKIDQT